MLNADDILSKIVELEGDCLKVHMCLLCPFAINCLPSFIRAPTYIPSKEQRFNMALDHITRRSLLDDYIVYSRHENSV